jgi:hypothetical protein
MNKIRVALVVLLSLVVCLSVDAQTGNKKTNKKKGKAKTESKVEKPTTPEVQQNNIPQYKQFSDPEVIKCFSGGFTEDHKLFLISKTGYGLLDNEQKKAVLNKLAQELPDYDIAVIMENQQRELWISHNHDLCLVEQWNNDDLQIQNYLPLELKRNGQSKVFYQIGGSFNGSRGNHSGLLNLRCGTYLFQNKWDVSASLSLGYTKSEKFQFSGNIGADSRVYFPIKSINLSPYAGAGIYYSFPPNNYFEFKILTGACWFVGNGSLDAGVQYGIKSGFSFTVGYTFRPNLKSK